ncbi:glycosyltransferase [Bacteroidota bacterium]
MIEIIAYSAIVFLGIRLAVVFSNVIFHYTSQNRWRTEDPFVSVLIPARNEESNIGNLLDCLLKQDYKNTEIIICDDGSTDNTAGILKEYCEKNKKISWFKGRSLPEGWTGKNFACHQLSEKANGDLFLFLDADMKISGDIIAFTAGYLEKKKLSLLSIFPKQLTLSRGERVTVPLMNWILLSLLPLPLVVFCKWPIFSAANGQFMFFKADHYRKLKCHKMVKSSPVEDIQIMKMLKKKKYRVVTQLGDDRVVCRMYDNYSEAVTGFSKNIFHFFSNSYVWTSFFVFFTSTGIVFVALWSAKFALLYFSITLLLRILISVISYQNIAFNLFYIPVQHFAFLNIISKALKNRQKGDLVWKERKIPI